MAIGEAKRALVLTVTQSQTLRDMYTLATAAKRAHGAANLIADNLSPYVSSAASFVGNVSPYVGSAAKYAVVG